MVRPASVEGESAPAAFHLHSEEEEGGSGPDLREEEEEEEEPEDSPIQDSVIPDSLSKGTKDITYIDVRSVLYSEGQINRNDQQYPMLIHLNLLKQCIQ